MLYSKLFNNQILSEIQNFAHSDFKTKIATDHIKP